MHYWNGLKVAVNFNELPSRDRRHRKLTRFVLFLTARQFQSEEVNNFGSIVAYAPIVAAVRYVRGSLCRRLGAVAPLLARYITRHMQVLYSRNAGLAIALSSAIYCPERANHCTSAPYLVSIAGDTLLD